MRRTDGELRRRIPLPRLLSKWGLASRKQAEEMVRAGRVKVGGTIRRETSYLVDPAEDRVEIDGGRVGPATAPDASAVWLALNKPRGVVTTTRDPEGRRTVMDVLGASAWPGLFPIGRLDRASAGLLLFSTDHEAADRLIDPRRRLPRRYAVQIRGHLDAEALHRLTTESLVEGEEVLAPMQVRVEYEGPANSWLEIVLFEGRNREIRRRLAAEDREVRHLIRTAFGPIELGDLEPGDSRLLQPDEVRTLMRVAGSPRAGGPSRRP